MSSVLLMGPTDDPTLLDLLMAVVTAGVQVLQNARTVILILMQSRQWSLWSDNF